jgi:hypothetical protein
MRWLSLVVMAGVLQQMAYARVADPLETALATLAADASDLHEKLPSFECKESFTSAALKGNKAKAQHSADGTVRVERGANGEMTEHFSANSEDGKPIAADKLSLKFFVHGGFADTLDDFLPERRKCFQFSLAGGRLNYASMPNVTDPACKESGGIASFAILDKEGPMLHHERRIDANAFTSESDSEAVEFNGRTFWIPKHVTAEKEVGGQMYQWEATYSGCRLFAATVKLLPGDGTEAH